MVPRLPRRPVGADTGQPPADVDVDMSFESGVAPGAGVAAASEPPLGQPGVEAGLAPASSEAPADEAGNAEALGGSESSDAVPEWAGSAPSQGLVAGLKGAPGQRRKKIFVAVGGVSVGVLLAAVAAAFFMGPGKKQPAPSQQQAEPSALAEMQKPAMPAQPVQKPAMPAQPVTVEKPAAALPAPAAQPAKVQPPAQDKAEALAKNKPTAAESAAAPVAKPVQPANPAPRPTATAEKPRPPEKAIAAEKVAPSAASPVAGKSKPVEKKIVAEKAAAAEGPVPVKFAPAPKPAVEKPAVDKPRAESEPAKLKPEKKSAELAAPGASPTADKSREAAEAYQRGNARLLAGALPDAIAAFGEALKLNPKDAQSQRGLGLAYAQSGKTGLAVRHLKLYLKASPNAPDRALIEKRIDQLGGR